MPRCCVIRGPDGTTLVRCEVVHADDEIATGAAKAAALAAWAKVSPGETEPSVEEIVIPHVGATP